MARSLREMRPSTHTPPARGWRPPRPEPPERLPSRAGRGRVALDDLSDLALHDSDRIAVRVGVTGPVRWPTLDEGSDTVRQPPGVTAVAHGAVVEPSYQVDQFWGSGHALAGVPSPVPVGVSPPPVHMLGVWRTDVCRTNIGSLYSYSRPRSRPVSPMGRDHGGEGAMPTRCSRPGDAAIQSAGSRRPMRGWLAALTSFRRTTDQPSCTD